MKKWWCFLLAMLMVAEVRAGSSWYLIESSDEKDSEFAFVESKHVKHTIAYLCLLNGAKVEGVAKSFKPAKEQELRKTHSCAEFFTTDKTNFEGLLKAKLQKHDKEVFDLIPNTTGGVLAAGNLLAGSAIANDHFKRKSYCREWASRVSDGLFTAAAGVTLVLMYHIGSTFDDGFKGSAETNNLIKQSFMGAYYLKLIKYRVSDYFKDLKTNISE